MKKEKIIAIVLGALSGLFLAFFVLSRYQFVEKDSKGLNNKVQKKPSPKITKVVPLTGIEVSSPKSGSILKQEEVELKFSVPANSLVIIATPVFEKAFYSKKKEVSEKVKLALGENVIKIFVYPADPRIANLDKEIKVYRVEKVKWKGFS